MHSCIEAFSTSHFSSPWKTETCSSFFPAGIVPTDYVVYDILLYRSTKRPILLIWCWNWEKYSHICPLEWNILKTYTAFLQHKKVLLIISLILLTKGNNSLNRLGDRHLYARNNTSILSKHKKIIDVHEAHVYAKSIESINNWRHSYILII